MFTLSSDRHIILIRSIRVVLIFLAPNLHYTDRKILLPLDDSYIYAQYTKSIAEGHPFRFTPGVEPSAGTTGLLYPFILAPFYLLNFRGDLFPPFIFFINGILFIISSLLIYELTGRKNDRDKACLGTWLFILLGSMAWGFLSGMEIGLFITIWLSLAIALDRGKETIGKWFLPITNKGRWLESMIIIKSPIITKETIQLTLSGMFMPFHIWTIEKIEKSCYQ